MRDCTPPPILAGISRPKPTLTASIKPVKEAAKTSPSLSDCSDSSTAQSTNFEADPRSSVHTRLSSIPQTPSVHSTEALVALTKQYHLPPSLLIAKPNSNPRHQSSNGVKKRPRDNSAEGPTPNANMSTPGIGSSTLDEGDQRSPKKQKKSRVNTKIWVYHNLRFEQLFAGDLCMLDALSDNSFLQQDTVPRVTITLPVPDRLSDNRWMTVIQGHLHMTRNVCTQLHKELKNFEVQMALTLI